MIKITTEEFVKKAKSIHGDRYNYELVKYVTSRTTVKIICNIHGIFNQKPHEHISGRCGCPVCGGRIKLTKEVFIQKAKMIHGEKYTYDLVEYKNNKAKVKIICPIHGVFEQPPHSHLDGNSGCPKCKSNYRYTKKTYIDVAKKVHKNKYNYKFVNYINSYTKIKILCKTHGLFEQLPAIHLCGVGCPHCKETRGEGKIRLFFEDNNIKYVFQKKFDDCINPKTKYPLLFDFYVPSKNILIEYDGEIHFMDVKIGSNITNHKEQQYRDKIKTEYAKQNCIDLMRIPYFEFNSIEEVLKNKIF